MAALQVAQVGQDEAARVMRAAGLTAAIAHHTPERIAEAGECFELRTADGASAVFVLRRDAAVMWIDGAGARVHAQGVTEAGLALCEEIARQAGCTELAFETNRPGLVRKAKRLGYRAAAVIVKKALS